MNFRVCKPCILSAFLLCVSPAVNHVDGLPAATHLFEANLLAKDVKKMSHSGVSKRFIMDQSRKGKGGFQTL